MHRTKGRTFLELLERAGKLRSPAREIETQVAEPPDVLASLRELAKVGCDRRPMLLEYFAFGAEELAVFTAPLWLDQDVDATRFTVDRGLVEAVCRSSLKPSDEGDANRDDLASLPNELTPFVAPVEAEIKRLDPTSLIISPHFYLNVLPLHAAMLNGRLLIEKWPVSYLPSPAMAPHIAGRQSEVGSRALFVGNPTRDLAYTVVEVEKAADKLNAKGIASQAITDDAATANGIRERLGDTAILHLACHAVLEQDFGKSGIDLADGRITAAEIMNDWDLSGLSLAFLSTCVSGLTVTGPSDEYLALARCFFYAGASTVVANLWIANEAPGECFANNFYKAWIAEKQSLLEAFRIATLATRELFSAPRHWASFMLLGVPDPRRPVA